MGRIRNSLSYANVMATVAARASDRQDLPALG